jgi:hypothetical protein
MLKKIIPPSAKNSTIHERQKFWEEVIHDQESGSLSMKNYCQSYSLKYEEFRRWKYNLKKKNSGNGITPKKSKAVTFAKVVLDNQQSSSKSSPCPIKLEFDLHKVHIVLGQTFDESQLKRILKVVGGYYASIT